MRIDFKLGHDDWLAYYLHTHDRKSSPYWNRYTGWVPMVFGHGIALLLGSLMSYFLFYFLLYFLANLIFRASSPLPPDDRWCIRIAHGVASVCTVFVLAGTTIIMVRRGRPEARKRLLAALERHVRQAEQSGRISLSWRYRLSIDAEGFTLVIEQRETTPMGDYTSRGENYLKWAAVDSVDVTDRHLFLSVEDPGVPAHDQRVIIIPAAAFPDGETFNQFVEAVRGYLGSGTTRTGITTSPREGIAVVRSHPFGPE